MKEKTSRRQALGLFGGLSALALLDCGAIESNPDGGSGGGVGGGTATGGGGGATGGGTATGGGGGGSLGTWATTW